MSNKVYFSDFESIKILLEKKVVDYDNVEEKLLELNDKISTYNLFEQFLLSPEYLELLKGFRTDEFQKAIENNFVLDIEIKDLNKKLLPIVEIVTKLLNVPKEDQNSDFIASMRTIEHELNVSSSIISDKVNRWEKNNSKIDILRNLLSPATESLKNRQGFFLLKMQKIKDSFSEKSILSIRRAKLFLFFIAIFIYILTEFISANMAEIKIYKVIFHVSLFSAVYFLLDPVSEWIKKSIKKQLFVGLISVLRKDYESIQNAIEKSCEFTEIHYSEVPKLTEKLKYFLTIVKVLNEEQQSLANIKHKK